MKRNKLSDWREDLREIVDVEPKTDKKSERKIDTKEVKNKVVINPAMTEAFEQIGAPSLRWKKLMRKLSKRNSVKKIWRRCGMRRIRKKVEYQVGSKKTWLHHR